MNEWDGLDLLNWRDAVMAAEAECPDFIAPNAALRTIIRAKPKRREELTDILGAPASNMAHWPI
jgi:hypothetical protein